MNERRAGWLYFAAGLLMLVGLAFGSGAEMDLAKPAGLWLSASIVLLLAAFVLEPWFSGTQVAISNATLVLLAIATNWPANDQGWWLVLAGFAVAAIVLGALVPASLSEDSLVGTEAAKVGRTLGGWKALTIPLLGLSLASFNEVFGSEWQLGTGVAVYAVAIGAVRPDRWLAELGRDTGDERLPVILKLPHEAVIVGTTELLRSPGDRVRLSTSDGECEAIAVGRVVAESVDGWRVFARHLRRITPKKHSLATASGLTVRLAPVGDESDEDWIEEALSERGFRVVGLSSEGSTTQMLKVEANPSASMKVGSVLWTHRPDSGRIYWQVTDATVADRSWPQDRHAVVRVEATQLGAWDSEAARFRAIVEIPAAAEPVLACDAASIESTVHPAMHQIGQIPGVELPMSVDARSVARNHCAILGTTGTGKTHLAFSLIDAMLGEGTRVICADLTDQYSDRFGTGAAVSLGDFKTWLATPENGSVAVYDLAESPKNPIAQMHMLATAVFDHVKTLDRPGPGEPPHFTIVLEEAQNFIPEGFLINDWDLKAEAQQLSKILMESRKFGLGFLIITQRTAAVTKTALSQCATVFAFRTVDQTSADYLEGLCGRQLVRALPTLPTRHAVAMGLAVSSDSPLIVEITHDTSAIH